MDLRSEGLTRERVLAAAFRMLDSGSLRVGSEPYTNENGSHGLATLLCAHVAVRKEGLRLIFPAKSGKTWESRIDDADLAAVVRLLKRRGGNARLLAYKDGRAWHPVSSAEINAYVKERTGEDFTAKDFRTLRATVAAAVSLAQSGPQRQVSARKRAISRAMQDTAAVLGNTPSIARKSYADPRLLDHFAAGETIDSKRLDSAESELRALLYREGGVVPLRCAGRAGPGMMVRAAGTQNSALMNPMTMAVHQQICEMVRQESIWNRWPGVRSRKDAVGGRWASRLMSGMSMMPLRVRTSTAASFTSVMALVRCGFRKIPLASMPASPPQISGVAAPSSRIVSARSRLPMSHRKPCKSTRRMAPKETTMARMWAISA